MINWFAPAKLNIFFYIIEQRENDHYHNVQTLFQLLDYGDTLRFRKRSDYQFRLLNTTTAHLDANNNSIILAARLLRYYVTVKKLNHRIFGVDIIINKKLPIGAGLGGGSSDAATTLIALNYLWKLRLPLKQLVAIGRKIGADVPLFIKGQSAFAEGIGDILTPVDLPTKWFLVITPSIFISTAKIFGHPDLPCRKTSKSLEKNINPPFYNDCESLVRKLYPDLNTIMSDVNHIVPIRLTGTGSAFFASFSNKKEAHEVQQHLPKQVSSFVARGINYSPIYNFIPE